MALNRVIKSITRPASGDLSSEQFRIVQLNADGRVVVALDGATPNIGVLLNKPSAIDQAAEIAIQGSIVKLEAGVAINENDAIIAVAGGRGSASTTDDDNIVGYAITPTSGSGELFEVNVTAPAQHGAP